MRPIDFFIAGTQKGGTTALDSYFRRTPSIQMANVKEIHFFDDDSLDWNAPPYQSFHAYFEWFESSPMLRGEATPIYMYWPNSIERIARYNAAAKLIVCLRHPAHRAHSHWRMATKAMRETLPFEDAINRFARNWTWNPEAGVPLVHSYLERGFYAPQIRRFADYKNCFRQNNYCF